LREIGSTHSGWYAARSLALSAPPFAAENFSIAAAA